jgi:hypothetical protein
MKNAIECEVEFNREGRPLRRKWVVGGIVVWGIVVIVLALLGKLTLPPTFWQGLKFW